MKALALLYGLLVVAVALLGCAPAGPAPARGQTADAASRPAARADKAIIIGQLTAIKNYGPWDFSQTGGGGASLAEVHTISLVSEDVNGNLEPRLAARLPSFDDGTITVLPDGRMRTVWQMRPDVTWHDGAPFSAEDLAFSWEVARHPEVLGLNTSSSLWHADDLAAVDRSTIAVTWKTTYFNALHIGVRDLWPFPKHLLAEAFQGDKEVFRNLPYFTSEYVHLGPFRLVEFGLGEEQVFERYDRYFLGQPRLNTIILRTIGNANTLLANLKAGALHIASEKTLSGDVALQLRDEWQASGEGAVLHRQDNWAQAQVQFDPQFARPPELSRDVRVRRGLFQAIDRDAMREFALPGISDTSGDTFMLAKDPRGQTVGQPFARYRYDPARAQQELAAAGWQRGEDGRLLFPDGRQVQIEVKADDERWSKEVALIADYWRRLGVDATEYQPSRAMARDREHRASFSGVTVRARSAGEDVFGAFDSRYHATPANRWTGGNLGHYANPALDRLIDRLDATLDEREQGVILKEMGELIASDLPTMPIYFAVTFAVVRKGVHALREDYAGIRDVGVLARRAHLWDRD
jgi:peptide/nickel transport system substrate-binding protein